MSCRLPQPKATKHAPRLKLGHSADTMSTATFAAIKSVQVRCAFRLFVGLAAGAALAGCSNSSSGGHFSSESEAAMKKQIESAENAEMQRHQATPPEAASKQQ